jgi:hypothetical protein
VSALASAFLSRSRRNDADLTGCRARSWPNALPGDVLSVHGFVVHRGDGCRPQFCPAPHMSSPHTLCSPSSATSVSSHGDGLLQLLDVLQVFDCSVEFPAVDSLCCLAGVLEADSEVGASAASRLLWLDFVVSVPDHLVGIEMG